MMRLNFDTSMAENTKGGKQNEIALNVDALRALIADLDTKIAYYEADIRQSDAETAAMTVEAQALAAEYDSSFY